MRTPTVNYVRRNRLMEDAGVEIPAACGHAVEVRSYVGISERNRLEGYAEVVSQPCSFCAAPRVDIDFVGADKTPPRRTTRELIGGADEAN